MVRVAASGDYHLTIRGADDGSGGPVSSVIYTLGEEAAVGAVAGDMRVNVGTAEATAAIDIAETRIFPADVAIGDLAMTSAVVSTAERPFGHFTTDTVFSVPAGVGVLVARANLNGELIGVNVVNPAPYIGTFDLAARTFSFSIQASSGGDSTDPDSQTSIVASLYGVIDNVPPVADAGGPARTVECASHTTTPVVLAGQGSYDPDAGDSITHYQWFTSLGGPVGNHPEEAVALPFGKSLFVLHVYDLDLSAAQTPLEVNVVDTTPPTLDVEPTSFCLWPPDHRRVRFHLGSDVSAVAGDICDPAPTVRITSVSSDEADNGIGDGDATGDIAFGPIDFCVRRERAGTGDGRVYTVTIEARDFSGNTTVREVRVAVPHDHEPGCAGKTAGTVIGDADPCH
ncbi:MAG: hypothetical protein HY908_20570 [Myxococcales bacterium]|nr:hypothetical protein [Myxococcales bacterium]